MGGDRRHTALARKVEHRLAVERFAVAPGALHLQIEAIAAQRLPAVDAARRLLRVAAREGLTDVSFGAAGKHDETLEHRGLEPSTLEHRRAALLSLEKRARDELREMAVTREVLAQKYDA